MFDRSKLQMRALPIIVMIAAVTANQAFAVLTRRKRAATSPLLFRFTARSQKGEISVHKTGSGIFTRSAPA